MGKLSDHLQKCEVFFKCMQVERDFLNSKKGVIVGSLLPAPLKSLWSLEFLFLNFFFGTIGFRLGDGIRCLEPEAQNTVLSLDVPKI